jgi:hypothetical protein
MNRPHTSAKRLTANDLTRRGILLSREGMAYALRWSPLVLPLSATKSGRLGGARMPM